MTDTATNQPTTAVRILRTARLWARALLLVSVVGFGLWTWGSLHFAFSRGERAGFVQKISKRGWLFKTWEGELAMVNLPGTLPEIFPFTIRNDDIAHKVESAIGKRVAVTYEQHRGIPSRIFGETDYFVVDVRNVAD